MIRLFLMLLLMISAAPAEAHERSRSNSIWRVTETGLAGTLYLESRQATLFLNFEPIGTSLEQAYSNRIGPGVVIARGAERCSLATEPRVNLQPDGRLRADVEYICARNTGALSIGISVFSPLSANHAHFLRVELVAGEWAERVLSRGHSSASFLPGETEGERQRRAFSNYVTLGFTHILGGQDHLAFLLALLLIVQGWRRLAIVTLGFTLGHSLTLALALLDLVEPPGSMIESLIGFSILFIAAEAALRERSLNPRVIVGIGLGLVALGLLAVPVQGAKVFFVLAGLGLFTASHLGWLRTGGRPEQSAPLLSAGFGLVHGVGFAGILLEIELPEADRLPALFGFNIGVELGQMSFVIAALLVTLMARRLLPAELQDWSRLILIAALSALGSFWFLSRLFS